MLLTEGKSHKVGKACLCVKAMRQLRRVHSCRDLLLPQFLPRQESVLADRLQIRRVGKVKKRMNAVVVKDLDVVVGRNLLLVY